MTSSNGSSTCVVVFITHQLFFMFVRWVSLTQTNEIYFHLHLVLLTFWPSVFVAD